MRMKIQLFKDDGTLAWEEEFDPVERKTAIMHGVRRAYAGAYTINGTEVNLFCPNEIDNPPERGISTALVK